MKFDTTKADLTVTSYDADMGAEVIASGVIEVGNCPFSNKSRVFRALQQLASEEDADITKEVIESLDEAPWNNDTEAEVATKSAVITAHSGYVLHFAGADDDSEVTIELETRRISKKVDQLYEIRRQKTDKNGNRRTIGEVDTIRAKDEADMKKLVNQNDVYSDYHSRQWSYYPLTELPCKTLADNSELIIVNHVGEAPADVEEASE